jgi:hypothetical protein
MSLARRDRSIHALTIPSCGIIFLLLRVEHVSLLVRQPNRANQIQRQATATSQPRSRHPHRFQDDHEWRRGLRLAGCRSLSHGLFRDR